MAKHHRIASVGASENIPPCNLVAARDVKSITRFPKVNSFSHFFSYFFQSPELTGVTPRLEWLAEPDKHRVCGLARFFRQRDFSGCFFSTGLPPGRFRSVFQNAASPKSRNIRRVLSTQEFDPAVPGVKKSSGGPRISSIVRRPPARKARQIQGFSTQAFHSEQNLDCDFAGRRFTPGAIFAASPHQTGPHGVSWLSWKPAFIIGKRNAGVPSICPLTLINKRAAVFRGPCWRFKLLVIFQANHSVWKNSPAGLSIRS